MSGNESQCRFSVPVDVRCVDCAAAATHTRPVGMLHEWTVSEWVCDSHGTEPEPQCDSDGTVPPS